MAPYTTNTVIPTACLITSKASLTATTETFLWCFSAQSISFSDRRNKTKIQKMSLHLAFQFHQILQAYILTALTSLSFVQSLYFEIIMHTLKQFNQSTFGKMKSALPENVIYFEKC